LNNIFKKNSKEITLFFLFTIFILILYIPFVLNGGFYIFDWLLAKTKFDYNDFGKILFSWFPFQTIRPFSALLYTIPAYFFGNNPTFYIIVNILFLELSLIIISLLLKKYVSFKNVMIFMILGSVPFISSSNVFMAATMLCTTFTFFLWALSLFFVNLYVTNKKVIYIILSVSLIFIALLIYEIITPLLIFNILYPILYYKNNRELKFKDIVLKILFYFIIIFSTVLIVAIYQKFIVPMIGGVTSSRISLGFSLMPILIKISDWFYIITVKMFALGIKSFYFFSTKNIIEFAIILFLMICFFITYIRYKKQQKDKKNILYLIVISSIALILNLFIFILSSYKPDITGYNNRTLFITWISIVFLMILLLELTESKILTSIFLLFAVLASSSMIISRDKYIESNKLQKVIITDCLTKINNLTNESNITVLGNVPKYLYKNYNDESVFSVFWDFGSALKIKSKGKIIDGNTVTISKKIYKTDLFLTVDEYWRYDIQWGRLCYYEYNNNDGSSYIKIVNNKEDLSDVILRVKSINLSNDNNVIQK